MSRAPSDYIFTLIHSLSTAEKRYFWTYATMGRIKRDVIYLQLFKAIDGQKSYDENELIKTVKQAKPHQLPNLKKHLTALILESLRLYHSKGSVDAQLHSLLAEIEILFNRRHFTACDRLIAKARELAQQYEKHAFLLLLADWEGKVLYLHTSFDNWEIKVDQLWSGKAVLSKQLVGISIYQQLHGQVAVIINKSGLRKNALLVKKLLSILRHPIMQKGPPESFVEQYYYYSIQGFCYTGTSRFKKSYEVRKTLVEKFELNPFIIKDFFFGYLYAVHAFTGSCLDLGKEKELSILSRKIPLLLDNPDYATRKNIAQLLGICNPILHYYCLSGNFEKGIPLIEKYQFLIQKFKPEIRPTSQMIFNYVCAYIYFGTGDLRLALSHLYKIINERNSEVRMDLQVAAQFIFLIVHFELGNVRELGLATKSIYRFLYKSKRVYKIESLILDFINKKIAKLYSKKDWQQAFIELKSQMEKHARDPFEKQLFEYFDFTLWLESKIGRKSFSMLMKEKWGKQMS